MDIKTRIDVLSEAEAKAALLRNIQNEASFRLSFLRYGKGNLYSDVGYMQRDEMEHAILDEALKEARK